MKVLYFGDYDPEYSRNRVIMRGLRLNGVEVIECNDRSRGIAKYRSLFRKYRRFANGSNSLIVGYTDNRWIVLFARLLSRKRIFWDAFYSLYESWVFDRRLVRPMTIKAFYYWFQDWLASKLAYRILVDTNQHIDYFSREFGIKREKFIRVFVGTDDSVFMPKKPEKHGGFVVHFHGKMIPLQGIRYILLSARELKGSGVHFNIIGADDEVNGLIMDMDLDNISSFGRVEYSELSDYISRADVCLGIFGNTNKAQRVIPNKVYEAIAMAKPVISADTPAMREVFTDRKNVILCRTADPKDLSEKILMLREDSKLRESIAQGGYKLFREKFTPKIVARELLSELL